MTDFLLELSRNPMARQLLGKANLPIPMPAVLKRPEGAMEERFLEGKTVVVGGQGALTSVLARTLARAGASTALVDAELGAAFDSAAEAFGRPLVALTDDARIHAVVIDATSMRDASDLKRLFEILHPRIRAIGNSGRVLILGRPIDTATTVSQAAARAALDGFNRSVAKELGGKGATSNVLFIEEGAETRASAAIRFLLSAGSAFVTAQPLRISTTAKWDDNEANDPWTRPLSGKVAVVTGAARGIGAATAALLAAEGAHVVCVDRPEDDGPLSETAREIGGTALPLDVTADTTPARLIEALRQAHGGVDIVVHNAGVTRDKTLARMSDQQWDMVLGINLDAILRITSALIDSGTLRDNGRVISLASISGIAGNTGQTNYAASKAGVIGFTRALAKQAASRGITVNAIAPGFIETRMTASVPVMIREAGRRLSALSQGGLPEDVGRAITFMATPGAAGVTGNVLRVCGGALLGA